MKKFINYLYTNFQKQEINLENILVRYSIFIAIICLLYSVLWFFIDFKTAGILNLILCVCFIGIPYLRLYKTNTTTLLNALLAFANFLIFALSVLTFKTTPTLLAWFTICPLFAILTLNKKLANLWALISLIFILISYPVHYFLITHTSICLDIPFNTLYNISQVSGILIFGFIIGNQYILLRDVQQHNLELKNDELIKTKNKLELTQKYKDRFFANISHEIRTPLNAIKGVTELFYSKNYENDKNELQSTLSTATNHLMVLINDILDMSKLGDGKITLVKREFNLPQVLTNIFNILHFESQKKNLEYCINLNPYLPKLVLGDEQRLSQILVNILSNAIKFTENGKVLLNVGIIKNYKEDAKNMCTIKINVTDTGIGIKEENLKMLFDEYYQGDPLISIKYGGTGLGLNISKKLVELHNGTIECISEFTRGTSIIIHLPFEIANISDIVKDTKSDLINYDFSAIDNYKILIVDDTPSNLLIEKKMFLNKNKTLHIDIAENGLDAIIKTRKVKYDIILMDMQMPIMDGLEATKNIINEKNNINSKTPIFGVTADVSTDSYFKCLEVGMKNVITKPFEMNTMLTEIISHTLKTNLV